MLRKLFKAVTRLVGVVVGLAVVVYVVAVAWNWRDEQPSPDALRLAALYGSGAEIADDDNAFVYLLGFEAPLDQSPRAIGARRLAWLRSAGSAPLARADDPLTLRIEVTPNFEAHPDPEVDRFLKVCLSDTRECAAAFADSSSVLERWTATEPWLLERYRELIAHDAWREHVPTVNEAGWGADISSMRRGQRLLLLHVKQLADVGDIAAVRELLGRDARFSRMMLDSAGTIATKMAAVSALRQHFHWGSLAIRGLPPGSMAAAVPAEWQAPMTAEELALGQALAGEWTLYSLSQIPQEMLASVPLYRRAFKFALDPLYQRQAEMNQRASVFTALLDMLDAPLLEFDTVVAESPLLTRRRAEPRPPSLHNIAGWLRNARWGAGVGHAVNGWARRAADVEGMRRAAVAVVTLRDVGFPESERAAALALSPWRNPYDDRPLRWDASDSAVVFIGLEFGERGEHRFHY